MNDRFFYVIFSFHIEFEIDICFFILLQEFELWKSSLSDDQQKAATGYFTVIKRHSESSFSASFSENLGGSSNQVSGSIHDLHIVPFSQEYKKFLTKAAELLHKAGDLTDSPR